MGVESHMAPLIPSSAVASCLARSWECRSCERERGGIARSAIFELVSAWWRAAIAVALTIGGTAGAGAVEPARADEVHALFVLNLTRFVRWPVGTFTAEDSALVIGVRPRDPVGGLLRRLAGGEKSGDHPIELRDLVTSADLEGCHVVYFSKDDTAGIVRWLVPLQSRPVLTVSDAEGFLRLGGHVQLYRQGGNVRLRVSPAGLEQAGLQASSQLLRVAGAGGR